MEPKTPLLFHNLLMVFNVRTSNETHRNLAIIAEKKKMKLNELVNKAFDFLAKNEDEVLN